jgi:beta-glucosidase/6-phospho-beta-glucosidase/beta-galactosidase
MQPSANPQTYQPPKFASFMWAGFECTYALIDRERRLRLDLLGASKHDYYCATDYQLISAIGAKTVREGFAWHQIDKGNGEYDFSRFEAMLKIAKELEIQQVWDLNHFDYPEYLDPYTDTFITQFAEYAVRCLEVIRRYQSGEIYIVPVNEISFYSWFGADSGWWAPFKKGAVNSLQFKKQLVKAAIAAMKAISAVDKEVRFIHVDPIMRRIPKPPGTPKIHEQANDFNTVARYQTWDMLSGRLYPELGGQPEFLDILGINYYMVNQEWIMKSPVSKSEYTVMIPLDSPDRIGFDQILNEIYQRYQRPMVITETGSHGEFRPSWWDTVLTQVETALAQRLPIYGVCSYPTVDKPTSLPFLWPQSGLWDFYQLSDDYWRQPFQPGIDVIKSHLPKLEALRPKVKSITKKAPTIRHKVRVTGVGSGAEISAGVSI